MAFLPRLRVKQSVSPRCPTDADSLLAATQKELWPLFVQLRKVLNWAAQYVGLVQVDASQEPVPLTSAVKAGPGVTITETGTSPGKQLQFAADPAAITNIVNVTNISNVTAAQSGATLFLCQIPDALLRSDCLYYSVLGMGYGLQWDVDWTQIAGVSTYQANATGSMTVLLGYTAGLPAIPAGARFFVLNTSGRQERNGIYEVVTPMSLTGNAVIRRVADANTPSGLCHNMAVKIADIGNGTSAYLTLTTADPIVVDTTALTFSSSPTRTSSASTNLLTPSQTSVASTSTLSQTANAMLGGSNDVAFFADGTFITKAGTPDAATVPKGPWMVKALLNSGAGFEPANPPRCDFKFRVVHVDNSTDADFLTVSSPPISATTPTLYTFQGNLGADVTIVPTDRIEARMYAHSYGAAVNVVLTWQNATRDTRIITTLALGGFGSGVHDDLTGRDNPNAHAFVCSVTEAGGLVPTVTANTVVVTPSVSGVTISGISTAGLTTGVKLNLVFKLPVTIANQATEACPAGYAPFYTFNMGGTPQSPKIDQNDSRVEVQYFATELDLSPCFVLNSGPLS